MAHPNGTVNSTEAGIGGHAQGMAVATFEWRDLRLHVVTREPISADEQRTLEHVLPKIKSVGMFVDALGMIFGRSVRIKTERPSPDVWLQVGM
jgi:hypothetical protein